MKTGAALQLAALRQRTDRDLLALVEKELARALILVDVAANAESPLYAHARKIHQEVENLLPALSERDRVRVEGKVKQLRSLLEQAPIYAKAGSSSVSLVS